MGKIRQYYLEYRETMAAAWMELTASITDACPLIRIGSGVLRIRGSLLRYRSQFARDVLLPARFPRRFVKFER